MFSGGLGSIEDAHVKKAEAETGNVFTQDVKFNAKAAIFTHIDLCPSAPHLFLSIRNGGGEDRRASVQDWCGRRSGLFCSSMATAPNCTKTISDLIW